MIFVILIALAIGLAVGAGLIAARVAGERAVARELDAGARGYVT